MKDNAPVFKTTIGGQAIIEGIMMRGPSKAAVVVRAPEGVVTKIIEAVPAKEKYPILGWPVLRGVIGFVDAMKLGMQSLMYSADYFPEDEDVQPSKLDLWIEKKFGEEKAKKFIMGIAVTFGLAFPILLFIMLPAFVAGFFGDAIGSGMYRNLLESALKLGIFLLFIILTSKMKDMKRVYSYHGAEHKTIHCYEAGLPLTVENIQSFPRQHPRCGTSFLLIVIVVSILVFSFVTVSEPWLRMLLRLALLPLVVGVAYELNRLAGKYDNPVTFVLRAPGLWLQNFTTREPEPEMIEIGIEALKMVVPEERGKDVW